MNHSFKSRRRFFHFGAGLFLVIILALIVVIDQRRALAVSVVHAAPPAQTTFQVRFSSLSYSALEDAGTSQITAQVSPAITDTTVVTVEYITLDGSATSGAGNDYLSASGVLTFTNSAATTTNTFEVTILDDSVDESNETISLILRNPGPNTVLGSPNTATLTIVDNDASPTSTPTSTSGAPPIFTDAYEPNNMLQEAYTTAAGTKICDITLWPAGDLDFFRFSGKDGSYYEVSTTDLEPGIDTTLTVFNPQGTQIASNDDFEVGNRRSQVTIAANMDGFYYARIDNRDPSDPADKTYCFEVREINPPTPTPSDTPPPVGTDDELCEFNSTIEYACTIGLGQVYNFNFVPVFGSHQDTDMFRIWMKPGIEYTCETTIPGGSLADTNIIFLDHNGNDFQPNLGNDDKELGDLGSRLSYRSTYTGWLHVEVGPVNVPPLEEANQHTYQLECTSTAATPTPTAVPTRAFTGGGAPAAPTATPFVFPTFPPSPTPIDLSSLSTPVPTPPAVQFQPLPTATPVSGGEGTTAINVTIYYDANGNFMPELTEGIVDTAVALYENNSGKLLLFGSTNEAGLVRFDSVTAVGPVRVVVPFLNYTQIVTGENANILVRVAPQPLPVGIP